MSVAELGCVVRRRAACLTGVPQDASDGDMKPADPVLALRSIVSVAGHLDLPRAAEACTLAVLQEDPCADWSNLSASLLLADTLAHHWHTWEDKHRVLVYGTRLDKLQHCRYRMARVSIPTIDTFKQSCGLPVSVGLALDIYMVEIWSRWSVECRILPF